MKYWILAASLAIASLASSTARAGDFLLAGSSADAVFRWDGSSTTTTLFASDPLMDGPTALVYVGSDLLVLNEFSDNVLKFNGSTGAFISTFISSASLGGAGVSDPSDMELGSDGNLYIMSHFNDGGNNIHRFNATTGAYVGVFSSGRPFRHQHGLTFGASGDLFQGNVDSGKVERFAGAGGGYLGEFTSSPVGPIADLAFSSSTLYVTCDAGGGVARFNAISGASLPYLVSPGAGASYWGIYVDGSDIYFSNKASGVMTKYNEISATSTTYALGGGAFDIVPMIPEPGTGAVALGAIAVLLGRRRRA